MRGFQLRIGNNNNNKKGTKTKTKQTKKKPVTAALWRTTLPCTFPQQIRRSTLLYNDLPCGTKLNSDSNPEDYIYYICMYIDNCSLVVIWLDCKGDTHDGGGDTSWTLTTM